MITGKHLIWPIVLAWIGAASQAAAVDEFVPLFNGRDLSGWVNVNCAPDTFSARDGIIVCTGQPTGVMRTERQYENFVLELEWMHLHERGNAGLFVWSGPLPVTGQPFTRSIEVQILDGRNSETYTSHGDVFAIQGATMKPDRPHPLGSMRCLPSEQRCHPAGQWNHYRVTCQNGVIKLAVNGKVVSGGYDCNPQKGYICLESEGSDVHFRNIRLQELPPGDPPGDRVAQKDRGFQAMFDGLSLAGWKRHTALEGRWDVHRGVIRLANDQSPRKRGQDYDLWTEKSYQDFVLIADWRLTKKPELQEMNDFTADGLIKTDANGARVTHQILNAGDSGVYLRGNSRSQVNIWSQPMGSGDINSYHKDAKLPLEIRQACVPSVKADNPPGQWNRFEITALGDRVTVVLNGTVVIEDAQLPDIPASGPIALQNHADGIEFRNLYIRELTGEARR